jgi:curli biogenesis system outer membrane secretion channel CsgG
MRRVTVPAAIAIAVGALVPASAASQTPLPDKLRPTVAVVEFDTNRTPHTPLPNLGVTLAELLAERLAQPGAFRVIDREVLTDEHDASDHRPPLNVLRARAEAAGIEVLALGALTAISTEDQRHGGGALLSPIHAPFPIGLLAGATAAGVNRTEQGIGLDIRLIDVYSGEIVAAASARATSANLKVAIGLLGLAPHGPSAAGYSQSTDGSAPKLVDKAILRAIDDAASDLVEAAPRVVVATALASRIK